MPMYRIKLAVRPGAQFHLGRTTPFPDSVLHDTDTVIHSDTLFSALINLAAKIGYAEELVHQFEKDLKVSSGFYLMEVGDRSLCFYPRPSIPLRNEWAVKKIKRIQFVSPEVLSSYGFEDWFSHPDLITGDNWIATTRELKDLLGAGKFESLTTTIDANGYAVIQQIRFYGLVNTPQVSVHSTDEEGRFYQTGNFQIADNRHLHEKLLIHFYFLLDGEPDELLRTVLGLLKDEGVGGQRSTGLGLFECVEMDEKVKLPEGEYSMSVSLINPIAEETTQLVESSFYRTMIRGGRKKTKGQRLKQVRMITEGAVFVPGSTRPYCRYFSPTGWFCSSLRQGFSYSVF